MSCLQLKMQKNGTISMIIIDLAYYSAIAFCIYAACFNFAETQKIASNAFSQRHKNCAWGN